MVELRPLIASITTEDLLVKSAKARQARAPKLTEEQNYYYYVFWYMNNLIKAFKRLDNAVKYIGDFPRPKSYLKQEITQYDWIQYHYHMYIVSVVSLYDIVLRLTNAVFRLGLSEKEAKRNTVEDNSWVRSTGVAKLLKALRETAASYTKARHLFVHEGDLIKLDELDSLDIHCIAIKLNIESSFSVGQLKTRSRPIVSNLLSKMSTEMSSLENQITSLFDKLLPIFDFWGSS